MERCLCSSPLTRDEKVCTECETNSKDPDVPEALEKYERSVVHGNRLVYKLEEIEYPDVSPSKSIARLFWNI
jgi:hypothetical protein